MENSSLTLSENPENTSLYLAYGPSKSGYHNSPSNSDPFGLHGSTPFGPSQIALGDHYLILPGHGTAKSNCGEVRFAKACSDDACRHDHGHSLVSENCGRLSCPTCRDAAIARAASRAVERVEGLMEAYEREGYKIGPLDHCQLSTSPDSPLFTPEALSTREGLNRAYQKARELLKKYCRGYGGILVLHPWRQVHLDGSECGRHDCTKEHTWTWSPHFHFIGFGWWVKSNEFYAATGWTYTKFGHGIKRRSDADESQRSLFNTLHYQLSHCGLLVEGRHIYDSDSRLAVPGTLELAQVGQVIRYVGMLSNSKGGYRVESASFEVQLCKHCKSDMHAWDVVRDDSGQWSLYSDRGPLMEWVEVRRWYINHRHKQTNISPDQTTGASRRSSSGAERHQRGA